MEQRETFEDIVREMDFDFLGMGEHVISLDDAMKVFFNDHFLFLDIRTEEEARYVRFPFALHIPLAELPERHTEIPRDRFLIVFCASSHRAFVGYAYLRTLGFEEVKGLVAGTDELAGAFKPGPLFKLLR